MSKKDKQAMTEDYLARIKWESDHPYMADGSRPDIPDWKYKPVYKVNKPTPTARLILTLVAVIGLIAAAYLLLKLSDERPGVGIVAVIILFSVALIFYFMGRDTK